MPITRYWTTYWREKYWAVNEEHEAVQSSGGSFRKRGVSIGDVLYIISQRFGQLLVGGRMTIGRIVTREEAARIRKRKDLYNADEWVIGQKGSGTAFRQHRQLAPEITKQLRFVSGESATGKPLLFVNDRNLDRQTTRIVRELTAESAALLDEIIEMTDDLPPLTTISIRDLRRHRRSRRLR